MDRTIAHLDMDAFFARVEKRDHPELRGKPVIVGGLGPRGVVSTACYQAREYGVHSAQPMEEARERCPHAEFRAPRGERYRTVSEQIRTILFEFTPTVETVSLDEAFLDISGVLHRYQDREDFARRLRNEIHRRTQLTCSVGIGPNKMISKLASEHCKPDGMHVVDPDSRKAFLRELPVEAMWGIGDRTKERMDQVGIGTVGDLQDISLSELQKEFGVRAAVYKQRAQGIDPDPVTVHEPAKSIRNETTFPRDLTDPEQLKNELYRMTDKMAGRARNKTVEGTTVTMKLRRGDFSTLTRSRTLDYATNKTDTIWPVVRDLFRDHVELDERGIRLVGAGLSNLRPENQQQQLFQNSDSPSDHDRRERLNQVLDELNQNYHDITIGRGRDLNL